MAAYFNLIIHTIVFCIISTSVATDEAGHFNSSAISRELLMSSYQESLQMVNEAFLQSRKRRSTSSSPSHVFTFRARPEPETLEIAQAAEVFEMTLQVLKKKVGLRYKRDLHHQQPSDWLLNWENVELIAEMAGCPVPTDPVSCLDPHFEKYRSISGVCNNRENPLWGAANTALVRWLPAQYEDGERQPKGWNRGHIYNGAPLPPVREVSKKILKSHTKRKDSEFSQLLVEWGQFLSHDIDFTPQSNSKTAFMEALDCNTACVNAHPCFPIDAPEPSSTISCMPFFRSTPACFVSYKFGIEQVLQRQQLNAISSFLDASYVYGSSPKLENYIRDLSSPAGKLAVNEEFQDAKGRAYMPFVVKDPSPCLQNPGAPEAERVECFAAGDTRANEALALTSLHTLWFREHNRIAEELKRLNDHWNAETVYQETRKIVGAMNQIINLRDYIPKIIGNDSFAQYIGDYSGYDATLQPAASNVFATAAMRFGHATISPTLLRLNERFQEDENFPPMRLHDTFFSPWRLVKQGGLEPIIRGLIGTAAISVSTDKLMSEEVTERLVVLKIPRDMDLASLNLQRGRDHALPGYNDWREFCGLERIKSQADFVKVVGDRRVVEKILNMYKHPDNIDVWLGGLVEDMLPGARSGPLFSCLIGKQMKVLREGDRFWWESPDVFTQQQREELSKSSLSRLICDNTDINRIPRDAFTFASFDKNPSAYLHCHHIPSMSLEAWREDKSIELQLCGFPTNIQNGDYLLSSMPGQLVAHYSCYYGFSLAPPGAGAVACNVGTKGTKGTGWTGQTPQCIKRDRV